MITLKNTVLWVVTLIALNTVMVRGQDQSAPPNIILIVADDMGYGDLSCYGQQAWSTPRIDELASQGARFTDFYVPTPYCAPSRATLLTGKYPFNHGLMDNPAPDATAYLDTIGLSLNETLVSQLLKEKGYATTCIGKWHLGHQTQFLPTQRGFDSYYGIPYSNDMRPVHVLQDEEVVEYPVVQSTLTKRYTEKALDFIEQQKDQPFFLYLPHAMPHKPLAPSTKFYTPNTKEDLYADVTRELDASVGMIMDKVKALDLEDNTVVIFMSDNGPWFGGSTVGLRGMKALTWEGGLRVPFMIRWPGKIPSGQVIKEPMASIDIVPTLLKVAGVNVPGQAKWDGHDMMPVLTQSTKTPHEAIYGMFHHEVYVVRSGPWKLHLKTQTHTPDYMDENWVDPRGPDGVTILGPCAQPLSDQFPGLLTGDSPQSNMLFNLETDPGEQRNVADEHPKVVRKLTKMYNEIMSRVDAKQ
ncbi:MAG: sulfatase [Cytophagales bacterium]|nr:sulfatase [Cytophagales bacterium]